MTVKVKPLDLSYVMRHAFLSGVVAARNIPPGEECVGPTLWLDYDPRPNPAYDRILAAIEAPAQKPVAWQCKDYADGWITYTARHADQAREYQEATGCTIRPLYTTPPDHLALVAAAYRDAADQCGAHSYSNNYFVSKALHDASTAILARTPADAEAHLTALLRAEYERGVREAAGVMDTYLENARIGQASVVRALEELAGWLRGKILALLTQEGR